jgi:hypothetical protein
VFICLSEVKLPVQSFNLDGFRERKRTSAAKNAQADTADMPTVIWTFNQFGFTSDQERAKEILQRMLMALRWNGRQCNQQTAHGGYGD